MRLEDLAGLRQLAYRLFSSTLLYPDERRHKAVAAAAGELRTQQRGMLKFAFFSQWQRLLTSLAGLPSRRFLEEEYVRVFMHSPEGVPCLPYESVYVDPEGRAAGWIGTLLEREYAVAGLALSPSLRDSPDHVAVELEFMAFLCGQEADAWDRKAAGEGVQILERQVAFLGRHLTRWVPAWARQVSAADGEGVYSAVAETTWAFIGHDQDLIAVLLDRLRKAAEVAQSEAISKLAGEERQPRGSFSDAP